MWTHTLKTRADTATIFALNSYTYLKELKRIRLPLNVSPSFPKFSSAIISLQPKELSRTFLVGQVC